MKNTLKALAVVTLCFCGFLFTNLTVSRPVYEVESPPQPLPLSTLVNQVWQQTGQRNVEIPPGANYYLDRSVLIDTLTINGQLHCDPALQTPVELKAQTIYVNGIFQCGTQAQPVTGQVRIILRHSNLNPQTSFGYRGMIVNAHGRMIFTGAKKGTAWLKLSETALPGDNFIHLDLGLDEVSVMSALKSTPLFPNLSWKVGDEIAIASTSYNPHEAEKFKITSIDRRTGRIGLSGVVQYRHLGETELYQTQYQGPVVLDQRAEVVNLTRSILITAEDYTQVVNDKTDLNSALAKRSLPILSQTQLGGHVMVHRQGFAAVDSVEFKHMGQAGLMARYPFHWHLVGDATGQFIRNSAIHESFQRCITVHQTNNTQVHNNACYNFKGHGYFLEDGNEVGNRITNNIGIRATFPDLDKVLLKSDSPQQTEAQGRFPHVSVFWISHPSNIIKYNVAAGSVGTGFWMSFEDVIKDSAGNVLARPLTSATQEFNYNTAHSTVTGFTWDGAAMGSLTNNPRNPKDKNIISAHYEPPVTPIFRGLVAYKNTLTGIYFRGHSARYENSIVADNGWSFWLAYNQKVKDTVMIGRSRNHTAQEDVYFHNNIRTDRQKKAGITLYDGPFELERIDFLNFATVPKTFTLTSGQVYNTTEVPFLGIGGTDKNTNITRSLSFSPEPYHRAWLDSGVSQDNAIRDLDGTLTGIPKSMLVWAQSMAILPNSQCVAQGPRFNNMSICPKGYSEPKVVVASNISWWSVPFNIRREDGRKWTNWNDNKFSTVPNPNHLYQLIFNGEYPATRIFTWINADTLGTSSAIIKVIGHGNNCRLYHPTAVYQELSSLSQLRAHSQTAYYREGNDFFYKVIPTYRFFAVSPDQTMEGDAYITDQAQIVCDNQAFNRAVKGKITSITKSGTSVLVKGWACLEKSSERMAVELSTGNSPATRVVLQNSTANLTSDESVRYDCASIYTTGYDFQFTVSASVADQHVGKHVYVKARSNQTAKEAFLENSGVWFLSDKQVSTIRYGANGAFFERPFQQGQVVRCSNAVFGDPIYGVPKACYNKTGQKIAEENQSFVVPCATRPCFMAPTTLRN